jgi:hypothetical protein
MPTQPSGARDPRSRDSRTRQAAIDAQNTDAVPPPARGAGTTPSRPDCSQMRGIEKGECERRDTVRDDLPAGQTATQPER